MSKKITFMFVIISVITFVDIYFSVKEKDIKNYPDEKFISQKDWSNHLVKTITI